MYIIIYKSSHKYIYTDRERQAGRFVQDFQISCDISQGISNMYKYMLQIKEIYTNTYTCNR